VIVPENVARIGKYYEQLQRTMQGVFDGYTDAELRLLLRFAIQGYETVLAATEALKSMLDAPKEKALKQPKRTP